MVGCFLPLFLPLAQLNVHFNIAWDRIHLVTWIKFIQLYQFILKRRLTSQLFMWIVSIKSYMGIQLAEEKGKSGITCRACCWALCLLELHPQRHWGVSLHSELVKAFQDKSFLQMDVSSLSPICHEAFFPPLLFLTAGWWNFMKCNSYIIVCLSDLSVAQPFLIQI